MAEPLTFFCYAFVVTKAHPWDDGRRVEAISMYTVARPLLSQAAFLDNWDGRESYMIGLHVAAGQTVEVSYRGRTGGWFDLLKDNGVTQDLNTSLGAEPGRTWVGFVPPDAKPRRAMTVDSDRATVAFEVEFRIKPVAVAQFVPFAGRYRFDATGKQQQSFANGFMGGMWWVPKL